MSRGAKRVDRRLQILDAATRTALSRGLFQIRVKDVAKLVGITEGVVMYYYSSLEELRLQVYKRASARWYDCRDETLTADMGPAEQLSALIAAAFRDDLPEVRLLGEPVMGVKVLSAFRFIAEAAFVREVARYQVILERGAAMGVFTPQAATQDIARNLVSLEESYRLHMHSGTAITAEVGLGLVMSYAQLSTAWDGSAL